VARNSLFAAAALLAFSTPASSHPHVWIDVRVEIVFDETGRLTAVRERWVLDANFTRYDILPAGDADRDGVLDPAEAENAIARYMGWIGYFDYFTRIALARETVDFIEPPAPNVSFLDGHFTVSAELVLAEPLVLAGRSVGIDVFDQELYYYFDFPDGSDAPAPPARIITEGRAVPSNPAIAPDAIAATGLPAGCRVDRRGTDFVDPTAAVMLQRRGLKAATDPAAGYPVRVMVSCD
jgi:ABC-type uncharacterized transport system substrate-binding protein